jgi:hypothetical protein
MEIFLIFLFLHRDLFLWLRHPPALRKSVKNPEGIEGFRIFSVGVMEIKRAG